MRRVICLNCEDAPKWQNSLDCWEQLLQEPGDEWEMRNVYIIDEQPSAAEVAAVDAVVVGGSHYSVYEGLPWMLKLQENLRAYASTGTPLIGCCFGHQIISQALGGKVEKNPSGRFVLGCETIELQAPALEAAGLLVPLLHGLQQTRQQQTQQQAQVQDGSSSCSEQQLKQQQMQPEESSGGSSQQQPAAPVSHVSHASSGVPLAAGQNTPGFLCMCQVESHGDCVSVLPEGAVLLASSRTAAHELWIRDNVLCFQFHPELPRALVLDKIFSVMTGPRGRLSADEAATARQQLTTITPDAAGFAHMLLHFIDSRSRRDKVAAPAAGATAAQQQLATLSLSPPTSPSPVNEPLQALVANTRDAVAAGLAQSVLPLEQLSLMNSVAAEQYGRAVDAAVVISGAASELPAKVTPVTRAVGALTALEQQVDALSDVVEQLEIESVMLAREVGV